MAHRGETFTARTNNKQIREVLKRFKPAIEPPFREIFSKNPIFRGFPGNFYTL
jgi:hypothetical protein